MKFAIWTLVLIALGNPPTMADPANAIDAWLKPFDAAGELSGVLLVARGDEVIVHRSYGRANFELDHPNRLDTRFNVASLTKPMTIVIAAALETEGKLGIGDPVSRWIPDFPRGQEITVMHLLQHRSGIPHRVTTPEEESRYISTADMAERIARAPLAFEPGSQESYSSGGFVLLARLLELASGQTYGQLLQAYVSKPAAATHTVHPEGDALIEGRASGYFRGVHGAINGPAKHLGFLAGAGSVFSTAEDVFRIQRRLLGGGYGERASGALVRENGLRWNGITAGYRTFADYHSDTDITVIWAGNLFTGAGDLMRQNVHRIAAGEAVEPMAPPVFELDRVPPEQRSRITGTYRLRVGSDQPLFFDGDLARLGEWVLIPTGPDRFLSPQDYAEVRVDRSGDSVALQWGAGPRFERIASDP